MNDMILDLQVNEASRSMLLLSVDYFTISHALCATYQHLLPLHYCIDPHSTPLRPSSASNHCYFLRLIWRFIALNDTNGYDCFDRGTGCLSCPPGWS